MKKCLFVLYLFITCGCMAADKPVKYKKLLGDAKAAIKNQKNQDNAEKNLLAVINREDITQEQRAEIYFVSQELERSLNDAENMKMYLKQAYDTVKFFSTILKMHEYLLACDSVETVPNVKGEVKYKYRSRSREVLKSYRSYVLSGGVFLLKRNKYAESYPYFDMYLKSAKTPFFDNYPAIQNEDKLPRVAYWATVSAYNANQPYNVLKHIDEAIAGANDSLRSSLQEYKVRCYEVQQDTANWMNELLKGNQLYPENDYFYLHLMDVYIQEKQFDKGIALCDTMLQRVGNRAVYWYGKSQMHLEKNEFDSVINAANEALHADTTLTEAYYNRGIAYLNKAIIYGETVCNDVRNPKCKRERETLMDLYRGALLSLEIVRRRLPEDSKRWASPLYRIYLNLNMGTEFAEMEKILNAQ